MYYPGDIVYGPFPYADINQSKDRLFLIIAMPNEYFAWGIMITSSNNYNPNDNHIYAISKNELIYPLPENSIINMSKLQTIQSSLIRRKVSSLTDDAFERVMLFVKNVLNF